VNVTKKLEVSGEGSPPKHPGVTKHTLRDCRNEREKRRKRREKGEKLYRKGLEEEEKKDQL
jgi:hypothetical protein